MTLVSESAPSRSQTFLDWYSQKCLRQHQQDSCCKHCICKSDPKSVKKIATRAYIILACWHYFLFNLEEFKTFWQILFLSFLFFQICLRSWLATYVTFHLETSDQGLIQTDFPSPKRCFQLRRFTFKMFDQNTNPQHIHM